jgi:hypothetical protein
MRIFEIILDASNPLVLYWRRVNLETYAAAGLIDGMSYIKLYEKASGNHFLFYAMSATSM